MFKKFLNCIGQLGLLWMSPSKARENGVERMPTKNDIVLFRSPATRAGGSGGDKWCPAPPFEIGAPHLTFSLPVAAYIQYCILKMWSPFWFLASLFGFWPPLLLNPGDGPACNMNAKGQTWNVNI